MLQLHDGAFDISIQGNGNIEYATQDDLIALYDPHLNPNSVAVGGGVSPSQVLIDIDGDVRSGRWDVGADQIPLNLTPTLGIRD